MRDIQTLLAEGILQCGTAQTLADRIGLSPSEVSHMLSGKRPITPETVAALASLLELSPTEAQRLACAAVVANPKNRGRAEALRRAFGLSRQAVRGAAVKAWQAGQALKKACQRQRL